MGRILAFDYGSKRTGIAVTDNLKMIATGLETIHTQDLIPFLKKYMLKEKVELLVIGEPKRMSGEHSDIEKMIIGFIRKLHKEIPNLQVERYDERFTSKMATQVILDAGLSKTKRQDKGLVDMVSATIILQTYLEYRNY